MRQHISLNTLSRLLHSVLFPNVSDKEQVVIKSNMKTEERGKGKLGGGEGHTDGEVLMSLNVLYPKKGPSS